MALLHTPKAELGNPCPEFLLPTLVGGEFGLKNIPKDTPFVVMFICNHCPYVIAIEERLITLGQDLKKQNIPLIAICSNDEKTYQEDSFENLKKNYLNKKMSFTYLHDKTQKVALAFGAVCTPDFFVYDHKHQLAYRGRLDDSWKEPKNVFKRELYEAVMLLKEKKLVPENQTSSMGCSIKWIG